MYILGDLPVLGDDTGQVWLGVEKLASEIKPV
jgi:hypothetical protein